jgi:hypothetical protein
MLIIGADYHPSFQQVAFLDTETGECGERKLAHKVEAERFYREVKTNAERVRMEEAGHAGWFERLLGELNYELWIGDPAKIRAKRVRKQKNDRPGCRTPIAVISGGSISTDLDAQSGKPRSATTAMAATSAGADADAIEEPTASHCSERRNST